MNQPAPEKSAYRPEIDGLRAFAVLSVVVYHAAPAWLAGGFVGVDVFFVISGFLITSHIFENLDRAQFSFADFFARRIRRIFPALIVVAASSLAFGWFVLLADEYAQLGKHIASGAAFITNFVLVGESGYFDNAAETKPMLHLWSLAVEEQFYIIWPLVLWLSWKRNFNLLTITVVVALVSFYLNLRFVGEKPVETFFWPVGRFWELLSGSILAWLLLYKREFLADTKARIDKALLQILPASKAFSGSAVSGLLALSGLLLLVYAVVVINEHLAFPSYWAVIPVLGAVLVIAAGSKAWLNRILLMNPIAVWFGVISYPLYLWHWPILSFLQIIEEGRAHRDARIVAVILAVLLAWLTYRLVEKPVRFGRLRSKTSAPLIALVLFCVGGLGYPISIADLSKSHGYKDILIKRKGSEHVIGNSLSWYKGQGDWLFLGNRYGNTVAKRSLAIMPSETYIARVVDQFSALSSAAAKTGTQVALLVGPNKSSVYAEYLPPELVPSAKRYSTFVTDELNNIENLLVVDPTDVLLQSKASEGILYWRTNTHWNQKGSFIAFDSLMQELGFNTPRVNFTLSGTHSGDLIRISGLTDFPLHADDNWRYDITEDKQIVREELEGQPKDTFGWKGVVHNASALNDSVVWVTGDSFTSAIKPYLEASFKEVRFIGHWEKILKGLPLVLENSDKKPDLVLVVRVERSF